MRRSRQIVAAEERKQLVLAVAFAHACPPSEGDETDDLPGTEGVVEFVDGVPPVREFAVTEFAAAMGVSLQSGRALLGQALAVAHRLPLIWARVRAGEVPAWRARRVAEATLGLPADGAEWVDRQVAPVVGSLGPAGLDRLVQEAMVRFDPEAVEVAMWDAIESRHVEIRVDTLIDGQVCTGTVEAVLDAADALELECAVADLAEQLARRGSREPLDVRRCAALGYLARGQRVLPEQPAPEQPAADESAPPASAAPAALVPRRITLHVRLNETALHGCGDGVATLTSPAGRMWGQVTVEQVQEWCATPGTRVVVGPVLDLGEHLEFQGYQPPDRLREQITTLNPRCVFPYCSRASGDADLDHIVPYGRGGPTSSENLAPLCRAHHRAKTSGNWSYSRLTAGEYLWHGPHGDQWITDQTGTRSIEPSPRHR